MVTKDPYWENGGIIISDIDLDALNQLNEKKVINEVSIKKKEVPKIETKTENTKNETIIPTVVTPKEIPMEISKKNETEIKEVIKENIKKVKKKKIFISNTNLILLAIFIIALVLKTIAAHHTPVSSDEIVYSVVPLNIIQANRLSTLFQQHVYNYLADIGYKLSGGLTVFSTRLPSVIFGALSVLLIFLLSKEIFKDKKIGLISATFFAFSGYVIANNTEPDMVAFFFILLSLFFLVRTFKEDNRQMYLAAIFFGVAVMVKTLVVIFIPVFVIFFLIKYKDVKKRINSKVLFKAIIIFLIVLSPIFIYNILLYKENGSTDLYFSAFGIGESGFKDDLSNKPWNLSTSINTSQDFFKTFFLQDAFLLIFGLIGLIVMFKKNNAFTLMSITSIIFLVGYAGGITGISSHALWVPLILSLFAGYGLVFIYRKIKRGKNKQILTFVFIAFLIGNTFIVLISLVEQGENSITLELSKYVQENIPQSAIIITDPRIYSGVNAWVFNDKYIIDGKTFLDLVELIEGASKKEIEEFDLQHYSIYYLECAKGSFCGWKPEDYKKVEKLGQEITDNLKIVTKFVHSIRSEHNINIYSGELQLPSSIYYFIDKGKYFWDYPIGWKIIDNAPDNYEAKGVYKILNWFGFLILYLDVLMALISIPLIMYFIYLRIEKEKL